MKKKLKHKLDFEGNLIGINCALPDYSLSFFINRALNIDLRKCEDFPYYVVKEEAEWKFSVFYYNDVKIRNEFILLNNQHKGGFLLEKYKQFDYFFLMNGVLTEQFTEELIDRIQQIKQIFYSTLIDRKKDKNLIYLQECLEIYLTRMRKECEKV